jgi:hypothetical protein
VARLVCGVYVKILCLLKKQNNNRSAIDGCGPIIIDGAFTKLYCNWDDGRSAGSSRFVRNCACFLAAIVGPEQPDQKLQTKQSENKGMPTLDWEGCLRGRCDILMDEAPLAIVARATEDPDANTSDFVIDNTFACGAQNVDLFGRQGLAFSVAQLMLQRAIDPFRNTPVTAVVPCVSLASEDNRKIVGSVLSSVLFGGRQMEQKAFFLFLAVCDQHLMRQDTDRRDVFQFFEVEIMRHIKSRPTFSEVGEPVVLVDAMEAFLGTPDAQNKTFSYLAS